MNEESYELVKKLLRKVDTIDKTIDEIQQKENLSIFLQDDLKELKILTQEILDYDQDFYMIYLTEFINQLEREEEK